MRCGCYSRLAWLILFLFASSAWAITPSSSYNGKINSAVSNAVADKLKGMGYPETDVRFQRHMNAMMKTGKGLMGGNTIRAVGRLALRLSPLSVLLLASDMTQENIDQDQVKLAGAALQGGVINDPSTGVVQGGAYWGCTGGKGGDPQSIAWQCYTVSLPWETWTFAPYNTASWTATTQYYYGTRYHPTYCASGGCQGTMVRVDKSSSGAAITCGKGSYINSSNQCVAYSYNLHNAPATYVPTVKTFEDAAADVKPETAAKPLADTAIAELANDWWHKTAEEDAEAIPPSLTNPVTPADVARTKSPTVPPLVEDWWSPAAPPTETERVPLPTPNTSTPAQTVPGDPATPGQGTQVDLGPDPNSPAPNLEATPTIQAIVGPLLNLMPDIKNFTVPGHSAICPTATANWSMYGRSFGFTMSTHCDLMEQNRAVIEAAMLVVWTLVATFIVLRA